MSGNDVSITKTFGLNLEEADLLIDYLSSDLHPIIVKVLNKYCKDMSDQILNQYLGDLNQDNLYKMATLKLKYEGAKQLHLKFSQLKQNLQKN